MNSEKGYIVETGIRIKKIFWNCAKVGLQTKPIRPIVTPCESHFGVSGFEGG